MADYNIRPTLKTINVAPQQYQFQSFTPQQVDMSLLANSMQRKEDRINNADKQRAIVENALGAIREKINTADPTVAKRFKAKVDDIMGTINSYSNIGRYGDAVREAIRAAGSLANDEELQGMVKTNKQYQDAIAAIKSRPYISDMTKERWLATNSYKFNTIKDESGNIIGTEDWKQDWSPVSDIDPATINSLILQAVNPDSSSTSSTRETGGTTTVNNDPNAKNNISDYSNGGTHSRSSSFSKERLDPAKIDAARRLYYKENLTAVNQMYENLKWKYSQLKEQIKTATGDKKAMLEGQLNGVEKQITNKNGIYQDAEDMFMNMTDELVNSAKYTKTARSSGSSDVTNSSKTYKDPNSKLPGGTGAGAGGGFSGYGFSISDIIGSSWKLGGTVGDSYDIHSNSYPINYSVYGKNRNNGGVHLGF